MTGCSREEDTDVRTENEQGSSGGTSRTFTCQKQQCEINTLWKINYEQQLLDILKEKSEQTDDDKTFSFSRVPTFKKLNDDQKYWAKIEVLGIIRRAKNMVF